MTGYLIDTGPLSAYLFGRPSVVQLLRPWIAQTQAFTSIIVYGEVIEYLKRFDDFEQRRMGFRALLGEIPPIDINPAIMEGYADVRRALRPPYGPGIIGDMDTIIAATALHHELTVVTSDGDFERVPSLSVILLTIPRMGGRLR